MVEKKPHNGKKYHLYGILGTVFIHALLFVFLLLYSFTVPNPPYPEVPENSLGMEVNLGNSETGLGDIQPDQLLPPAKVTNLENSTNVEQQKTTAQPVSDKQESLLTSNDVESAPIKSNSESKAPPKVDNSPKVNDAALFKGSKGSKAGVNQGIAGGIGDQGKPGGNPNSDNYIGEPGNGGKGGSGGKGIQVSPNIQGRIKDLIRPPYDSKDEGVVVVEVSIDEKGNIINVRGGIVGSTTNNRNLIRNAEEAAKKSKYSASGKAAKGYITYTFIRM